MAEVESFRKIDELVRSLGGIEEGSPTVKGVLDRLQFADEYREQQLLRVWRWRQLYRQRVIKRRRKRANLTVPTAYEAVEEIAAQVSAALMGEPPFFFTTRNPLAIEQVEAVQRFLDGKLGAIAWKTKVSRFVRETLISGTGILKWGLQMVRFSDRSKTSEPMISPITVEELWVDPMAHDGIEPGFVIHQVLVRLSKLRKLADEGVYKKDAIEQVQELRQSAQLNSRLFRNILGTDAKARLTALLKLPDPFLRVDPVDPLIPVLEYYGPAFSDKNGEIEENRLVSLAFGAVPLRNEPNPYQRIPFAFCRPVPAESGPYGISTVEVMEPSVVGEIGMVNAMIDLFMQSLGRMYVAGDRITNVQNTLSFRPGGVIRLGGPLEDFKQLETADVPQSAFFQKESLAERARSSIGAKPLLRGEAAPPRKTFGEVQTLATSISTRLRLLVDVFSDTLTTVIRQVLRVYSKWMRAPEVLTMQGPEGEKTLILKKDELATISDLIQINADPDRADTAANRGKILSLITVLQQFPELRSTISLRRLGQKILEASGFHHQDPILLLPDDFEEVSFRTIAPEEEHRRVVNGIPIEVLPQDPHTEHIRKHLVAMQLNPVLKEALTPHVVAHFRALVQTQKARNRQILQGLSQQVGVPPVSGALEALGSQGGS